MTNFDVVSTVLPQKKSGVTARKVGSYRKKSGELPQADFVLPQNCRELPRLSGVTANCRELPQTIVGSYRKKSRELPQKSRELPQEKSGVTAKNVGNEKKVGSYRKKSRELPQEKSGVTAKKVGSYRKLMSGVTANIFGTFFRVL